MEMRGVTPTPHQQTTAGEHNTSGIKWTHTLSRAPASEATPSLVRKDVSDSESGQWIFLFPLVSQGSRTEVQYEEKAVQQTPGTQQLEVLIVLLKKAQNIHIQTEATGYLLERLQESRGRERLTSPPAQAGTADCLSNHVIDFKLSKSKHTQRSEQGDTAHYKR